MKRIHRLIATSACIGALMTANAASAAPGSDEADRTAASGRHGAYHHPGWGRGGHRGGFGRFCGKHREARTERMISVVEGLMTFTPKQEAAWKDLTGTVLSSNKSLDETCETLRQDRDKPRDATQRLARLETVMTAGLKFIQTVRPKFDRFYQTLSDKQKKAIDDLSGRRRPR